VALVAAAIVVANPVAPPVRDLQISTTQLSTSPEALIPFDKNLLKSISQPTPSPAFNAALAQILGALAAEADRIGTEVNSDVSTPLPPAATASATPPVYAPLSAEAPPAATPNGTPPTYTTIIPAAVAANPTIQQVVSDLTAETAYLGNQVVEAAYAAVNALVNTPDLIVKAVQAVLVGDLATAFKTIIQAVRAFFDSGLILVGGIDGVIDHYVPLPGVTPPAASTAANSRRVAAAPATAASDDTSAAKADTTSAESGSSKPRPTHGTGAKRSSSSVDRSLLAPGSAANVPDTTTPPRSTAQAGSDRAEPKAKASGSDKAGSPSSGRSQKGASAGD
jgi:hypothetical protein